MTKRDRTEAELNERRSRFIWQPGEIEVIRPEKQPQADPDQAKSEASADGDKGLDDASDQGDQSKQ